MEDLLKFAESIRRFKWLVLAVGVVAMLAALAVSVGKDSTFTANTTLVVGAANADGGRSPDQDAIVARGYVEQLNGASYQNRLHEEADIPDEVDLEASTVLTSPFFVISATSTDADQAIAASTAAGRQFVKDTTARINQNLQDRLQPLRDRLAEVAGSIPSIEAQLANSASLSAAEITQLKGQLVVAQTEAQSLKTQLDQSVSVVASPNLVGMQNEASTASENKPKVLSNAILGLLGGLVLGSAIAIVLGALQLRVNSPSVVRSKLGMSTLASISGGDPRQRQEDLQGLASGMGLMASGITSVAVTSPGIGEGKTLVASNLARYRAALGDRVILIDANFRGEDVGGRRDVVGLAQLLASGDMLVPDALVDSGVPNLKILPSGHTDEDPYALVTGERLGRMLEHASPFADLLVIDTSALLTAAESQVVCAVADRTILVIDSVATQTSAAVEARDVLERVHARVLGVVLTRVAKRGAAPARRQGGGSSTRDGRASSREREAPPSRTS